MHERKRKHTPQKRQQEKRGAKKMPVFAKKSCVASNRIGRRIPHTRNPGIAHTVDYSPYSETPTFCKIGRTGTSISVVGKNNKVIELSDETIVMLNNAVKRLNKTAKIPVYGLSRAEIGNVISNITDGTSKRASVFLNPTKSSRAKSYMILLQEGE